MRKVKNRGRICLACSAICNDTEDCLGVYQKTTAGKKNRPVDGYRIEAKRALEAMKNEGMSLGLVVKKCVTTCIEGH